MEDKGFTKEYVEEQLANFDTFKSVRLIKRGSEYVCSLFKVVDGVEVFYPIEYKLQVDVGEEPPLGDYPSNLFSRIDVITPNQSGLKMPAGTTVAKFLYNGNGKITNSSK